MQQFETPQRITVDIALAIGNVRILASDRTDTTIDIQARNESRDADRRAAADAKVDLTAGHLTVRARTPWRRLTGANEKDGAIDITIELPSGSDINGHVSLGDCAAEGSLGQCRFRASMGSIRFADVRSADLATMGDIAVDSCRGNADIKTSAGQIRIGRVGGTATIKNSSGDTWLGRLGGRGWVRAVTGDVEIEQADGSLTVKSTAGRVHVGQVASGKIELRAVAGAIEVGVSDGVAAWLDVAARYGSVRNELTEGEPEHPSQQTVEIRASSVGSDVVLRRVTTEPPPAITATGC